MLVLVVIASILIAVVTVYQYREEAEDYHRDRLERKEQNIKQNIDYVLEETTYARETEYIPLIFKEKIYEIKQIHNLELYLYDLEGSLLIKSKASFVKDSIGKCLPAYVLNALDVSSNKHFVEEFHKDGQQYQTSYSYITDKYFKPLAILNLPYIEDDGFIKKELKESLTRLAITYLLMIGIAIALAYFLSNYITRSLNEVSEKITETRLDKRNKKITVSNTPEEISTLVNAYNGMIDELESSAAQLATSEREAAWREMAKQVAHEIKNPLTPMRLTVQSFQRKFDPNDPNINEKLSEYTDTIIQQIDTMSNIASAFSNYAQMPAQKEETLDVVKITKLALDIFNEDYIYFNAAKDEITARFDRSQLIRVVNNLVKNSTQAIDSINPKNPRVDVNVFEENKDVVLTVTDNGVGVSEENKKLIFEPKFTTKSSGMGLGLAMVKNIVESFKGTISFTSEIGQKTTFTVRFPKQS
ncbi:two-component sensor histidine kinase [Patiriisocius marinistellae]|uniref:histidine kinase n=1 Tax=Patiriisocius marinistellae TaxID=2494560 RepID=A0A5J4FUR9_9FLAO|nr:ATP-binding protein [Patiriisocius marinistellae]GEQ84774.1 two-component sensor histidine kinase [Patiriisocius marinistellae]